MSHPAAGPRKNNAPPNGATLDPVSPTVDEDAAADTDICTITPIDPDNTSWQYEEVSGNTNVKLSAASGPSTKLQRSGTGTLTAGVDENATVRIRDKWGRSTGQFVDIPITIGVLATGSGDVAPTYPATVTINTTDAAYTGRKLLATISPTNSPSPASLVAVPITNGNDTEFEVEASGANILVYASEGADLTSLIGTPQLVEITPEHSTGVLAPIEVTVNVADSAALGNLDLMITGGNRTGGTLTNQLFISGVVAADGEWGPNDNFQLFADDAGGLGAEVAAYQIDNTYSGRNDLVLGNKRGTFVAWIQPSIASGAGVKVHASASASAPPTGTLISIANIEAMPAMSNGGFRVGFSIGGTAYEWIPNFSASTTYSKTAQTRQVNADDGLDWRSGPILRSILIEGPFVTVSGGTPHASGDGMRAKGEFWFAKAGLGAVDGGNPIILAMGRIETYNAKGDGTQYVLDDIVYERATSLSDGTLISTTDTDWITDRTLTYDFTGDTGDRTAWPGGAPVKMMCIGQKPILALPGNHTIVAGLPTTNALATTMGRTKLVPYQSRAFGSVSHSSAMTQVNSLNQRPYQRTNVSPGYGGYRCEPTLTMGNTSGRADISVIPQWALDGLSRPDDNGLRRIFENADSLATVPWAYGARHPDDGFKHKEPASGATPRTVTKGSSDPWSPDIDHHPEMAAVAYMLTGFHSYYNLEQSWFIGRCVAGLGPGSANETPYGTAGDTTWNNEAVLSARWKFFQTRGISWNNRSAGYVALLTPDRQLSTDIHGAKKTAFFQHVKNIGIRGVACLARGKALGFYEDPVQLGFLARMVNYAIHNNWQFNYASMANRNFERLGLSDANLAALQTDLFDKHLIGIITQFPTLWTYMTSYFNDEYRNCGGGDGLSGITTFQGWLDDIRLRRTNGGGDSIAQNSRRYGRPGVTCTLSALSGSSIQADFSANIVDMTYATHLIDAWFTERTGAASGGGSFGPGYGKITAVPLANRIIFDTPNLITGGTISSATASTVVFPSGTPYAGTNVTGNQITITAGTGAGQTRAITGYNAGTRTATVSPNWDVTPDATSIYSTLGAFSATSLGSLKWSLPPLHADDSTLVPAPVGSFGWDWNYMGGTRANLVFAAEAGASDAAAALTAFEALYPTSSLAPYWSSYAVSP